MGDTPSRTESRSSKFARFEWRFPGERPDSALVERLASREPPEPTARVCAGETVHLRGRESPRLTRSVAEPAPNSPLLMRLWTSPFRLDAAGPKRAPGRPELPWEVIRRQRRETTVDVLGDGRPTPVLGNPMRALEPRVGRRPPRLSVDAWLGSASP